MPLSITLPEIQNKNSPKSLLIVTLPYLPVKDEGRLKYTITVHFFPTHFHQMFSVGNASLILMDGPCPMILKKVKDNQDL